MRALDFSEAAEQVRQWVALGYYPGAALLIGRGERTVFEASFGCFTPDTVEFIASAGKWLAAAVVAAVVDAGALSWGDRVGSWLPELEADAGAVELRQLLSHTSGFAPQLPEDGRGEDQTLEASVARIAALALVDRPGTVFRYGGLALQVAGRMVELATGESFEASFQRRLALPLGLRHTRFTPVDAAPGHGPMLAGGARSSARDYSRFLCMLANGGRFHGKQVLSEAAVQEMERDQVGGAVVPPGELVERVRGSRHGGVYGLGLWRERIDASGRATHVSSPSWAGTYPWIDRQRGVYGVLVAHVDTGGPAGPSGFNPFYSSPTLADRVASHNLSAGKTRPP